MKRNPQQQHFTNHQSTSTARSQGTGDRVRILRHQQSEHSAAAGVTSYMEIQLPTKEGISLHDITPQLRQVCGVVLSDDGVGLGLELPSG